MKSNNCLHANIGTHTGQKPYSCKYCTLEFSFNSGLKRHEQVHITKGHEIASEISKMVHFCRFCKKDFVGPEAFKIHESEHKPSGKNLSCKFCDKTFQKVWQMKNHESTHTGCAIKILI